MNGGELLLDIARDALAASVPGQRIRARHVVARAFAGAAFCVVGAAVTAEGLLLNDADRAEALSRSASLGAFLGAFGYLVEETMQIFRDVRTHLQLRAFVRALEASQGAPSSLVIVGATPFSGRPFKL